MTVRERIEIECPVCGNEWEPIDSLVVGELLDCGDCGCELEVSNLAPLQINEAPQEEEDWGE